MKRFINYKNIQPNRYQIDTNCVITDSLNSDKIVKPRKNGQIPLRTVVDNRPSSYSLKALYNYTFKDLLVEKLNGVVLEEYPDYIICKNGYVFSLQINRMLVTHKQRRSCCNIDKYDIKITLINKNGKSKQWLLHRLLATAFIPNPENKPEVNHIDGNPENNDLSNLEWVTHQENARHATENRLIESIYNSYKISKVVYKIEYEKSFESGAEAANELDVAISNVLDCCKNNTKPPEDKYTPPSTCAGKVLLYGKHKESTEPHQVVPKHEETDINKLEYKIYNDIYAITKDGRLYNFANKRFNKLTVVKDNRNGSKYLMCSIKTGKDKYKSTRFASLVAQVWLGEKPKDYIINHKNGNKLDCSVDNLEYIPKQPTVTVPVDMYNLLVKEEVIDYDINNIELKKKYGIGSRHASDTANKNKNIEFIDIYTESKQIPYTAKGYIVRFC